MNTLRTNSSRFTWLAVGLAIFTALIYILIASNVLGVGNPQVASDGGSSSMWRQDVICRRLLILLRNRWLLLFGTFINFMVILFFFSMYQTRPEVMLSPGGLISKLSQILLEILLLFVLVTNWKRSK
ncbi:MAG: hypothetical protein MZV63_07145 [Marinilabiliales bacterium]|nr:hypothetical protein [Marinilabiliales bacterium]